MTCPFPAIRKNLIKSAICGLMLGANGQVFAHYFSAQNITGTTDLTNSSKWGQPNTCGDSVGTGTFTMLSTLELYMCPGHTLTLSSSDIVSALGVDFSATGSFSGTLKFNAGNKIMHNSNPTLPSIALDLSAMSINNTISILSSQSVTFSSVTGGNLSCSIPPAPAVSYTSGALAVGSVCTVTAVNGTVSAPIDLNFSKTPETYSTEIKSK